jgi:aminomethyltransferase
MSKHRITGADALAFLNRLVTREVSRIKPGRVGYCVWCNDDGQVIDDGTIFHLRPSEYRLCSQERQLDWLMRSSLGFDVQITEETDDVAALAVQGPTSCAVLRGMGLEAVELLKPYGLTYFDFEGAPLMVSRTGFTGDLGYELWIAPAKAEALWDRLFTAGRDLGITPIGVKALDMARIEAGFIQAGVDFLPADVAVRPGRTRSPFELGLGWLVDFSKSHFTGRKALTGEAETGSKYHLVKLDIQGNKPARDAFIYNRRNKVVGTVTSAIWSPSAKANIALACVEMPWGLSGDELYAEIYYQRELKWTRVMARCQVVDGVFFDPPRRRVTPAGNY